jgi:hypothetical protein
MHRPDEIHRELSVHALDAGWKSNIQQAPSESSLIALGRAFLASHEALHVSKVPGLSLPRHLANAADVSLLTFRLRRMFCSAALEASNVQRVEQLLAFFEALSERLFELRAQEDRRRAARISASG